MYKYTYYSCRQTSTTSETGISRHNVQGTPLSLSVRYYCDVRGVSGCVFNWAHMIAASLSDSYASDRCCFFRPFFQNRRQDRFSRMILEERYRRDFETILSAFYNSLSVICKYVWIPSNLIL